MADFGDTRLPLRFWKKTTPDPQTGCWLWIAATTRGYGVIGRIDGTRGNVLAHRLAYSTLVAAIPAGLTIDHLCKTESCVNPEHMEPVTNAENVRRSTARQSTVHRHASVTHCPKGHEYSGDNLYVKKQKNGIYHNRQCRTCNRERRTRQREARRAAISR